MTLDSGNNAACSRVHSLYQDLYLTDLKNDISEQDDLLQKANQSKIVQDQELSKVQSELQMAKRTIDRYRKTLLDVQREKAQSKKLGLNSQTKTSLMSNSQFDNYSHS